MIFRRAGRTEKIKFTYKNSPIEIVNQFTYLGVLFKSSGIFRECTEKMTLKGISALAAVWQITTRGRMSTWTEKVTLFNSIASSVALYGAHLWCLRYTDIIERVQTSFLKRALGVGSRTAGYLVRLETNSAKLTHSIVKQGIVKILESALKNGWNAIYKNLLWRT